jgi:hypothetical protein
MALLLWRIMKCNNSGAMRLPMKVWHLCDVQIPKALAAPNGVKEHGLLIKAALTAIAISELNNQVHGCWQR